MCRIDDGEYCDVWREADRRAAKGHQCTECGRPIDRGERYLRIEGLYAKSWTTMRLCAHCRIGADWLRAECGGFTLDGVIDEIREHAEEYRSGALWRIVAGAARKWRRFDGNGLMEVPAFPPLSHPTALLAEVKGDE